MEKIFKNIHNLDDLNKAIEESTNVNNRLLELLDQLETARSGGSISSSEDYEKDKAKIEKELLKEQEKQALLANAL